MLGSVTAHEDGVTVPRVAVKTVVVVAFTLATIKTSRLRVTTLLFAICVTKARLHSGAHLRDGVGMPLTNRMVLAGREAYKPRVNRFRPLLTRSERARNRLRHPPAAIALIK